VYLPQRLHLVRLGVKKLRYALELASELGESGTTDDLRRLRRAQATLGRLHDLQVLAARARDEQAALTPPSLAAWREMNRLVSALEDDCRRLHGRYMREAAPLGALCSRFTGDAQGRVRRLAVRQTRAAREQAR
jgi:CHAD domain-containing protein